MQLNNFVEFKEQDRSGEEEAISLPELNSANAASKRLNIQTSASPRKAKGRQSSSPISPKRATTASNIQGLGQPRIIDATTASVQSKAANKPKNETKP